MVEVATSSGRVRGELGDDGLAIFKGIPYAAPPVGPLRFAPPEAVESWSGVADATTFGPASIQGGRLPGREAPQPARPGMFGGLFGAGDLDVSEDCLYLNVWTPGCDDRKRPVLVWIHGGAFRMGTGAGPGYDGAAMARRGDVVVVTLNYRLGLLGFLYAPEIGAANLGLLDQVAALEWVQREIAAFGGDPEQVTIFGESAGGKSVECLLAMPAARGLFTRAVMQSSYATAMDAATAGTRSAALLKELDLRAPAGLRDVPLEDLMRADAAMAGAPGAAFGAGPVVDGVTLPVMPIDAFTAGDVNAPEVIVGTTLDESRLFGAFGAGLDGIDEDALVERMRAMFGADDAAHRAIEVYRKDRAAFGESEEPADVVMAAQTDQMFRQHSIRVAEALASRSPATHMYLFTWKGPAMDGKLGACHGIEIPFVFGTLHAAMGRIAGDTPESRALSTAVQDAWLAFATSGKPVAAALPDWPAYDAARRATMLLGPECRAVDDPLGKIRELWQSRPS